MLLESAGPCPLQKSLACPRLTLQLPQNQWLMIIQVVCFHFIIATSQRSPPLMYLDGDDEVARLLDVSYTFTVWNVYINQQNCR